MAPSSARMRARHASVSSTGLTDPERTASAASRRPSAKRSPDGIEDLGHDLEASERGHQVGAGVALAHGPDQFLRHLDPGAERAVAGLAQTPADGLGDRDARDLVGEEVSVTRAGEREDTDQDRHGRAAGLLEEAAELGAAVPRPGVHPPGSRRTLPAEGALLP